MQLSRYLDLSQAGWIGVDLDGTLAEHPADFDPNSVGAPVARMVARVQQWLKEGKDVRIFTARTKWAPIRAWCKKYIGRELPITNKKDKFMIELWDDRAVGVVRDKGVKAHANDTQSANIKMERHGLPITIEHPKGTLRTLHNDDGKVVYSVRMYNHYGYFNGTKGRDGDEVDCIVGPIQNAKFVYVVHMLDKGPDKDQREDEDKCMVGFTTAEAAKRAFLLHYPKSFFGSMTVLPVETFKEKMKTASLPYRRKKITARGLLVMLLRKEGAEGSQSNRPSTAHTEHTTSGRCGGAGRASGGKVKAAGVNGPGKKKCPKCGSDEWNLLPPDFEMKRCADCGKVFE